MTNQIKRAAVELVRCESGVTLVEYGIAVALAVAIGTAGLATVLSGEINTALASAGSEMPN
jgi:pilus assembly protein Flp/PilA